MLTFLDTLNLAGAGEAFLDWRGQVVDLNLV